MKRLLQGLALAMLLQSGAEIAKAEPCFDGRTSGSACGACDRCGFGCGIFQRRMGPNAGGGKYAYSSPCAGYGMAPSAAQWPTVAYPYYTTRGPRDFLMNNPPSIGR